MFNYAFVCGWIFLETMKSMMWLCLHYSYHWMHVQETCLNMSTFSLELTVTVKHSFILVLNTIYKFKSNIIFIMKMLNVYSFINRKWHFVFIKHIYIYMHCLRECGYMYILFISYIHRLYSFQMTLIIIYFINSILRALK